MYYEFYLDVYFLENLMMNFLVLQMTGHVIRRRKPVWRLALAAAAGSIFACIVLLLPIHRWIFLSVTASFICGCAMAAASYKEQDRKETERAIFTYWMLAFLMGGIWQFLMEVAGMKFLTAMLTGYGSVWGICRLRSLKKQDSQYLYEVTLIHHGRERQIRALLDSGNQLRQPITGRPVQVLEADVLKELLEPQEEEELEHMMRMEIGEKEEGKLKGVFTYIPFHSIGKEHGIMPLIALDTVLIKHGESVWNTKRVLTAVSKTAVSSGGEYQMILHPRLLE